METLTQEPVWFPTLLCVLTALKDTRFDLVVVFCRARSGALVLADGRDLRLINQSLGELVRADGGEEVGLVRIELVRSTGRAVEQINELDQTEKNAAERRLLSRKIERIAVFSWCKCSYFKQNRVPWKSRLSSRKTESTTVDSRC